MDPILRSKNRWLNIRYKRYDGVSLVDYLRSGEGDEEWRLSGLGMLLTFHCARPLVFNGNVKCNTMSNVTALRNLPDHLELDWCSSSSTS